MDEPQSPSYQPNPPLPYQSGPGLYPGPYSAPHQAPYSSSAPYPAWGPPLRTDYAHWGRRAAAALIDFAPGLIGSAVLLAGLIGWYVRVISDLIRGSRPTVLDPFNPLVVVGLSISVVALGIDVWNRWIVCGRTGQSLGKRLLKIWLINERTGRPIGPLLAFARDLVHRLDSVMYVGYLWPLWDERRQTFADKIIQTVVVTTPPASGELSEPVSERPS